MITCKNCGTTMPDGAAFCTTCGVPLDAQDQQSQQQPPIYNQTPAPGGEQPQWSTPPQQPPMQPQQPNMGGQPPIKGTIYLVFGILTTLLCCLPLGIPAIVFATKIDQMVAMGNIAGAQEAAKKSRLFSILAAALGLLAVIIYFVFVVVVGVSIGGGYYY